MNTIDLAASNKAYTQKSTNELNGTESSKFTEIIKEKGILNKFCEKYNLNVIGSSKFNFGSMTTLNIAPNILKEMANDPEKRAYYEGVIKDYFAQMPQFMAFCVATDSVPTPATITFNSDGSWVESVGSVPSPKKLARIRREQEEKKKKKQEKKKLEEEINNSARLKDTDWYYLNNINYILGNDENKDYKSISTDENNLQNVVIPEEKMFNDMNNPMSALVMRSELKVSKLRLNKI